MLLRIINTTDGQYKGKYVEYNEVGKILTLPNGESLKVEEAVDGKKYTLSTSNYVVNLVNDIIKE